jgi:hypothetical protein
MPRQKSLVTVIRDLVRREISDAIAGLLGTSKAKTKRRRRRGKRGPGRPPGSKNKRRRGRPSAGPQ